MNPIDDHSAIRDEDRQFDLLVDGELSEADRRLLLCRLDREPDGWRRCALAFLQAQCWKQEFKAMARPALPSDPAPRPAGPHWGRRLATLLSMAASFLLALVLGVQLKSSGWLGGPAPDGSLTTGVQDPVAGVRGSPQRSLPQRLQAVPPGGWQMVTLTVPQGTGGREETIHLPAVERESLDPQWVEGFSSAVPSEVLQALKQSGHQIEGRRELVPFEMKDGRRLVVPVDQFDIHFVGRPAL